ncbi:MAG: STAS/SEC14 domain-containing protein [Gammaproteobacteria bacterium]|nr:STAS/SEC14 domain-containing protein [Gammaproteobacteria bacterium]
MSTELNNIAVLVEPSGSDVFLSLTIHGNLCHQDYVQLIPMLDAILEQADHRPINVLVDITDLESWIIDTAWDDFQLGLQHRREFKKLRLLAIKVGNKCSVKLEIGLSLATCIISKIKTSQQFGSMKSLVRYISC